MRPEFAPGLDGDGARLYGGRWNSPGVPLVYCAPALSLAALEVLVHLPPEMRRPGQLPALAAVELDVPDALVVTADDLPDPADLRATRTFGDTWAAGRSTLGLLVPSRVVPLEYNVLLNPMHPASADIRVLRMVPFVFDDRPSG